MAITDLDIANMAFVKLGLEPVTSLSESTDQVTAFNKIYPVQRRRTIIAGKWRFARKRVALVVNVTAPVYDWSAAFDLPTDSLLVLSTDDDGLPWIIEGSQLLCSRDSVSITYIRDVTDPDDFTHAFTEALSELIASDLAPALTGKAALKEVHYKLFLHKVQEARTLEAQQGTPPTLEMSDLEDARFGTV